jgi:L-seryl-tRNA(Ser) seleniumtransferase
MRALRVDKITLAVLEATLAEYDAGRAANTIPVQRMLHASADDIEARVRALAAALDTAGWRVATINGSSAVGGGSAPGMALPTVLLSIERDGQSAAATEEWLRTLDPPVIARIEHDRVVLDLRTVMPDQDAALASQLTAFGERGLQPPLDG